MCGKNFKSSAYWFLRKKTDFPDKCSGCRLANRDRMRQQIEDGQEVTAVGSKGKKNGFWAADIRNEGSKKQN